MFAGLKVCNCCTTDSSSHVELRRSSVYHDAWLTSTRFVVDRHDEYLESGSISSTTEHCVQRHLYQSSKIFCIHAQTQALRGISKVNVTNPKLKVRARCHYECNDCRAQVDPLNSSRSCLLLVDVRVKFRRELIATLRLAVHPNGQTNTRTLEHAVPLLVNLHLALLPA
jgi:hypothetical protein